MSRPDACHFLETTEARGMALASFQEAVLGVRHWHEYSILSGLPVITM